MNYSRIALAGLGGTVAYFALGFLLFALLPWPTKSASLRPCTVGRIHEARGAGRNGGHAPGDDGARSPFCPCLSRGLFRRQGVRFGFLVAVFAAGSFVLHNYVSLNIGLRLALLQAVAYFVQLFGSGVVIALIYRPTR
jgi:hypothetical protein